MNEYKKLGLIKGGRGILKKKNKWKILKSTYKRTCWQLD